MKQKTTFNYEKLKSSPGIYKHKVTGKYLAIKKINGTKYQATFDSISEARFWRSTFNGNTNSIFSGKNATLKTVWETMKDHHFPLLATSTKQIWERRFDLLEELQHYTMDRITPSVITGWVEKNVKYFKSSEYENNCRGKAKRCNLNNELNLFTTIFNWYQASEQFEHEAINMINPVKTKHKKMGFIRPASIKEKAITLEYALKFFSYLRPPFNDLALFQYYTASRIGETAGLQWSRVDFPNRKITIMETCCWDMANKTFLKLNNFPKNKTPRQIYMTNELKIILERMLVLKDNKSNFVFHLDGRPLNYGTIQLNYREAQRKGKIPYSGTHILRHGMAKLARKVGGGLDAVIAMTGHKDYKLADHYSKLDFEFQKEVSEKIMSEIRLTQQVPNDTDNIISLDRFRCKC